MIESDFDGQYPFTGRFFVPPAAKGPEPPPRLHYLDEGPRDAPPVLFVHGNPTWSFAFRHLIQDLRRDHRCVAVDHVGCGRSDKPQAYDYTLARHQQNLQCLVEELGLRGVTLVAHDWGGAIGCGVAGRMPDRFRRLVLMNTAAFRSDHMPVRIAACRWPVVGPLMVRGGNAFARAAITQAVERPLEPAAKRGLLAPYDSWRNRVAIQRFVEDIPTRPSHPSYDTLVETETNLAKLADLPALLLWGERDWCFTPAFREEFERRLKNVTSVPIADAGHYVFEDARRRVVEEVRRFVTET